MGLPLIAPRTWPEDPSVKEVPFVSGGIIHAPRPLRADLRELTPCPYAFCDRACGYQGAATSCSKTLSDCIAKGNEGRFGGSYFARYSDGDVPELTREQAEGWADALEASREYRLQVLGEWASEGA